jgi:hypothetical protein
MDPASAPQPRPRPRLLAALDEISPYWGPQVVVGAAILIDLLLPDKVTIGPAWLLPSIEGVLLMALALASPHPNLRHSPARRNVALALIALVSAVNIFSLVVLCHYLIHGGHEKGRNLLLAGVVLWVTNVLLFGLWYWELDRGGPVERAAGTTAPPDFLFQQMSDQRWSAPGWRPGLIDYLYISFTNATAFSPTDTMPLTPIAKSLMSAQALTSLVTVGLVVARAVGILQA